MPNLATLATRYAGRPVLMLPRAAEEVAHRLHDVDARAFERPSRLGAILRTLTGGRRSEANGVRVPRAMEDAEDYVPVPFEERAAYAPLYAGDPEDLGFCYALVDGVALMQCNTPIADRGEEFCGFVYHGYDTLLQGMREAMADDRVRAIFLRLASPGGVVAGGLPELAAFMRANRAAAGGKPIHVFADMACSAAYWIAAQADRIVAPGVGLVGSIGAVIVHEDWSAALEKAGVAIEAIQFGASKTDGAWWAKLSPKAREDLQAEIDQCGRNFVADVIAGRPQLTAETILATEASVYMAAHDDAARSGLALGLVDAIAGEEEAFQALVAQVSTPEELALSPAAVGGRAATNPGKDKPMADKAQTPPGRTSALARAAALRAEADRVEAEGGEGGEDTVAGGEGEDTVEGGSGDDTLAGGAGDDVIAGTDDDEAEAQAIAASAEAKANPTLALSAIQTGMSLTQFKAAASAASSGGRGQLSVVLADAPRLGPDGEGDGKSAKAPLSAAATFQRNLQAGLSGRRR